MSDSVKADLQCRELDRVSLPLANKFYRQHGSKMRARGDEAVWLAEQDGICGALRLRAVGRGHWLTGLFTRPDCRKKGVASLLVSHVLARTNRPVWLFCHPDLVPFYGRFGFDSCCRLPEELTSRLARYRLKQRLCALELPGAGASTVVDRESQRLERGAE